LCPFFPPLARSRHTFSSMLTGSQTHAKV
jgi:hypothetical protein